jgi:hypothetical protein
MAQTVLIDQAECVEQMIGGSALDSHLQLLKERLNCTIPTSIRDGP